MERRLRIVRPPPRAGVPRGEPRMLARDLADIVSEMRRVPPGGAECNRRFVELVREGCAAIMRHPPGRQGDIIEFGIEVGRRNAFLLVQERIEMQAIIRAHFPTS